MRRGVFDCSRYFSEVACRTIQVIGKSLLLLIALSAVAPSVSAQVAPGSSLACQNITLFHREGCPHCERAHEFLDELATDYPNLVVERHDVQRNAEARARLFELTKAHGIGRPGVPALLVCEQFSIGFDNADTTGEIIRSQLAGDTVSLDRQIEAVAGERFSDLTLERLGLPLFTIVVGLIDGFNPCAMWVLAFLLSLLAGVGSRSRMVLIAGTFVLISGLMYFAFMAAWLNTFLLVGFSRPLQVTLASIALLIGSIHIKDFFAFKRGLSLSIPEGAKPTLFARVRRVVTAERLAGSLIGVAVLAVLVNIVEFLCTAGLPAVYTQILTLQPISTTQYYGYLALYNLAYIFDDALMVGIAVTTLSRWKMQEHHGRWLKLVSGLTIVALGALLLFAPGLLL
jgi:glutaredoxin